jgi:hypothetical protein
MNDTPEYLKLQIEHQQGRIDDLELEVRNLRVYITMLKGELNDAQSKLATTNGTT